MKENENANNTNGTKEKNIMTDKVKVWDIWVRVFHWSLAALIAAAFIAGEDYLTAHASAGYVILFLIAGRVLWGFIGTRHARFSDFVHSPAKVAAYIKDMLVLRHRRHLGHNPAAGLMVVALIASATVTILTGMAVYGMDEAAGPFKWLATYGYDGDMLEEVHGFFAWSTLAMAGLHVAAAALESLHFRENLTLSMITGYKKKEI